MQLLLADQPRRGDQADDQVVILGILDARMLLGFLDGNRLDRRGGDQLVALVHE